MRNFKSTKKYYQFYRYGFAAISLLLLVFIAILILTESSIEVNGVDQTATISNTWPFLVLVIILLIIHFLFSKKVAYVEVAQNEIKIESSDGNDTYPVESIDSIKQIQFIKPPTYSLKLKDRSKTYFFVVHDLYLEVNGFIIDLSGTREKIKK